MTFEFVWIANPLPLWNALQEWPSCRVRDNGCAMSDPVADACNVRPRQVGNDNVDLFLPGNNF
jgi:hypothetical protein